MITSAKPTAISRSLAHTRISERSRFIADAAIGEVCPIARGCETGCTPSATPSILSGIGFSSVVPVLFFFVFITRQSHLALESNSAHLFRSQRIIYRRQRSDDRRLG